MPDLVPVDYDPFAPQGALAKQVSGFPQRAADLAISALGPLGEAGMTVGDWLRTGGASFDTRDIAPVAAGVMLGTAAPEAEEGAAVADTAQAAAKGIRAFHGSPYDFPAERLIQYPNGETAYIQGMPQALPDIPQGATVLRDFPLGRMRLDKIGTGEGAQAYGHGLYSAENENVARNYRDALSGTRTKSAGKMYEVNIAADPEHFLDWDKPLSEQPKAVQDLLASETAKAQSEHTPSQYVRRDVPVDPNAGAYVPLPNQATGEGFYSWLANRAPGNSTQSDLAASQALRQAGIPGIKYLDQGSRQTEPRFTVFDRSGQTVARGLFDKERAQQLAQEHGGRFEATQPQQTHNYVVFDDSLISILKKYGLAGLIAGGAAHFKTTPVDHQPQFQ